MLVLLQSQPCRIASVCLEVSNLSNPHAMHCCLTRTNEHISSVLLRLLVSRYCFKREVSRGKRREERGSEEDSPEISASVPYVNQSFLVRLTLLLLLLELKDSLAPVELDSDKKQCTMRRWATTPLLLWLLVYLKWSEAELNTKKTRHF